ncbi:hypothetical protein CANINC_004456 [Pichia inconspicua]|uniref:Protein transport protein SEC31 n=1 Tax=Pichia inconspicua TaxID=52247 RepID=A0A4T0WVG8_9ASCO|nr:hypothetical protein CANINC_004456 [[Candida] inconspicua]
MVKLADINETATFAWSYDALPKIVTGTLSGVMDDTFSSDSQLSIYEPFQDDHQPHKKDLQPIKSFNAPGKFSSIDWNSKNVIAGGLENSTIQLYDSSKLLDPNVSELIDAKITEYKKHTTPVLQVKFNRLQDSILASSGSKGEIYIWDTVKNTSLNPGQAISPMNKVSSLDWNKTVSHIFGTAGDSGYASIWDLKVKREVLQLTYNNLTLSTINWHSSQSTKLVTATDNDSEPLILTWDLRNSSVPEKIMKGHKKGILSLDWCHSDSNLLLTSGRDDSVHLWNPIEGVLLATYPTSPNWINQAKFAPKAPEIFAASSLSKKVSIQTIQDTSDSALDSVKTENESDFWNQISTTETQQPSIKIKQAPLWLTRPISANFGYGGRLSISHGKDVKIVNISTKNDSLNESAKQMIAAIATNDFATIIEAKKSSTDPEDWDLLSKQAQKVSVEELLQLPSESSSESSDLDDNELKDDEDFFAQITNKKNLETSYLPSGEFSIISDDEFEKKAIDHLISNNIEDLIDLCIETDHINEALIISMNKSKELQDRAKNAYFKKNAAKNSFARLLYSSSNNSISDIVKNAHIESWALIAKSIINFSKDKASFNVEMRLLGDRLLESNVENSRNLALSCYIAANSLEKVASIWLSELDQYESKYLKQVKEDGSKNTEFEARFKALADVIEKIVIFQSSSLSKLNPSDASELTKISKVFIEYADCLVNFGHYELAYKLLNLVSDNIPEVKIEKNRISKAFLSTSDLSSTSSATNQQSSKYAQSRTAYGQSQKVVSGVAGTSGPAAIGAIPPLQSQQQQQKQLQQNFSFNGTPASSLELAKQRGEKKRNPYVLPQSSAPIVPDVASPSLNNPYAVQPTVPLNAPVSASPVQNFQPLNGNTTVKSNNVVANPYAPKTALDSLRSSSPNIAAGTLPPNPYAGLNGNQTMAKENVAPPSVKKDVGGWNDLPQHLAPTINTTPAPPQKQYQRHTSSRSISQAPAMPVPPSIHNHGSKTPTPPPAGLKRNTSKNPYAPKPEVFQAPTVPIPQSPLGRITSTGSFNPAGPIAPPLKQQHHPSLTQQAAPPPPAHKNPYAPKTQPMQPGQQLFSPQPPLQQGFNQLNSPLVPPAQPVQPAVPPPPPSVKKSTQPSATVISPDLRVPQAAQNQGTNPEASIATTTGLETGSNEKQPGAANYDQIVTILKNQLETVKPNVPEKFHKHIADAEKRINMLFNHLAAGDLLTSDTISKLTSLCEALENKDIKTAKALKEDIATNHADECGTWMVGVNRLIGIVEVISK